MGEFKEKHMKMSEGQVMDNKYLYENHEDQESNKNESEKISTNIGMKMFSI